MTLIHVLAMLINIHVQLTMTVPMINDDVENCIRLWQEKLKLDNCV